MKKVLVVAAALVLLVSAVAIAGNNPAAKVAVHVRLHNAKAGCNAGAIYGCADIVTTHPAVSTDAFPVFYDLVEYVGVEYGMCWPAAWGSAAWNNCAPLVIGQIYNTGDGASHTWTECQYTRAIPSFVWVYAYGGYIEVCPHPVSGIINVLDCEQGVDDPCGNFRAWAGNDQGIGDDPCEGASATEQSTWGGIKGVFK